MMTLQPHPNYPKAESVVSEDEYFELDGYDVEETPAQPGSASSHGTVTGKDLLGGGHGEGHVNGWGSREVPKRSTSADSVATARPSPPSSPPASKPFQPSSTASTSTSAFHTPQLSFNGNPASSSSSSDADPDSTPKPPAYSSPPRNGRMPSKERYDHDHNHDREDVGLGIGGMDPSSSSQRDRFDSIPIHTRPSDPDHHQHFSGGRGGGYGEGAMEEMQVGLDLDGQVRKEMLGQMTMKQRRIRYFREAAVTGVFVLSWYLFATLLSLYNKWMFSPDYYGFTYPLFVSAMHMVIQFGMAAVVRKVWSKQYRPREKPSREDWLKKIVPTAMATGMDVGLSNLSLKTITLTLYTMCKSSALIFVIGFAFYFKLEKYSVRLLSVITFISFGVFLMVFNATTVSIPGILMVFSASALGGLRWALTQLLMHKKEMGMSNPFATIFWLAPVMAVTLAFVSMAVEGWFEILRSDFFHGGKAIQTLGLIIFPGSLAFSMVASEYFIIQRAGIVPLSIAGIFKEVSTITVSAWVFGDELTKLNELGVVVTVGGIALYSYHKYTKSVTEPLEEPRKSHDLESYEAYESLGQAQEGLYPSQRLSFVGDRDGLEGEAIEMENGHGHLGGSHVIGDEDEDETMTDGKDWMGESRRRGSAGSKDGNELGADGVEEVGLLRDR